MGTDEITCHKIFGVNAYLTRKTSAVMGDHLTDSPNSITYSRVARYLVWNYFIISYYSGSKYDNFYTQS